MSLKNDLLELVEQREANKMDYTGFVSAVTVLAREANAPASKPRVNVGRNTDLLIVNLADDLFTDTYVIGPVSMFAARTKRVRELLAFAGTVASGRARSGIRGASEDIADTTLRELIDRETGRGEYCDMRGVSESTGNGGGLQVVGVTSTEGTTIVFQAGYWAALVAACDTVRLDKRDDRPAVGYNADGVAIALCMPVRS